MKLPTARLKFSLDLGPFDFYVSAGHGPEEAAEPEQQGSTSGDLSLAPRWDHDTREPVARIGFQGGTS